MDLYNKTNQIHYALLWISTMKPNQIHYALSWNPTIKPNQIHYGLALVPELRLCFNVLVLT